MTIQSLIFQCDTFQMILLSIVTTLCYISICNGIHDKKKLNVVIFFTHADGKCVTLPKDTLAFLNVHEVSRVKFNSNQEDLFKLHTGHPTSSYCKDFLKDGLTSLTHFCHTVMKMKTAVASIASQEMTNDIQEPESPYHPPHIDFTIVEPTSRARRSYNGRDYDEAVPAYTAKNFITGRKHTEVFQIRLKRQIDTAPLGDKKVKIKIVDETPSESYSKQPSWDVLDIVKHVRYSFLGPLFETTLQNQIKSDQDDLLDLAKLGQEKQDPGLFNTVKSTLDTLLEPPDAGFLMIILGGHLNAVSDKHSPIVQSIKYVIENTEDDETLLILTGSCANEPKDGGEVPVYVKGPCNDGLSKCTLLYDIPLAVKRILEKNVGTGFDIQPRGTSNLT